MYRINLNFEEKQGDFLPLTMTRPIYDLKVGVYTIREKWLQIAHQQNIAISFENDDDPGVCQLKSEVLIPTEKTALKKFIEGDITPEQNGCRTIRKTSDIISNLQWSMLEDMKNIRRIGSFRKAPDHVQHTGKHEILLHEKSEIEPCFINTTDGPVFIDEGARVMQGSMLRGPIYIGKHSTVKMGATLYQGTCIGEHCLVGGEIKNSIVDSFSNKSHHGYLGDSYIGQWCNLGAGTSCSNLRNTASDIKVYNMNSGEFELTGPKCGVIMGDHVRTSIHTAFNSGTVVGPFSNIFDAIGLAPKYIPPFSWGVNNGEKYIFEKLVADLDRWHRLKNQPTQPEFIKLITQLYQNRS